MHSVAPFPPSSPRHSWSISFIHSQKVKHREAKTIQKSMRNLLVIPPHACLCLLSKEYPNSARTKPQHFFRFLIAFSPLLLPVFPIAPCTPREPRLREILIGTDSNQIKWMSLRSVIVSHKHRPASPPNDSFNRFSLPDFSRFSRTLVLVGGCQIAFLNPLQTEVQEK
jgi:hypothetical protein